jgi:hypothetical protein
MIGIIIGTTLSLVLFFSLALLGFVKETISLTWLIFPGGAIVTGFVIGAIQGYTCFTLNAPVKKFTILLACIGAGLVYFSTDISGYFSEKITVTQELAEESGSIAPGIYPVRQLMSFKTYLKWILSESTYYIGNGKSLNITFGKRGTTLLYFENILGAMLGSFLFFLWFIRTYPQCSVCRKYFGNFKKRHLYFEKKESLLEFYDKLQKAFSSRDIATIESFYPNSKTDNNTDEKLFRATLRTGLCKSCNNIVYLASFSVKRNQSRYNKWKQVNKMNLCIEKNAVGNLNVSDQTVTS